MLVQVPPQRPKAKLNTEFLKNKILINTTLREVCNYHLTQIWETLCSSVNNDPALLFEEGTHVGLQVPSRIALFILQKQLIHHLILTSPGACFSGQKEEKTEQEEIRQGKQ